MDVQRNLGRWFEIARVPNHFEKDHLCDGPTADYRAGNDMSISVVQPCHQTSPTGPETFYRGVGRILDPGTNAKCKLTFFKVASREYWVIDHAGDYSWAIVGDPIGIFVWIFSRTPVQTDAVRLALTARAQALGFDVSRLEYPPQTKP